MANGLKKQKQKWKALAKHKSSLVLYLITILSAAITVFVLGYLIVYILANGIPHLKPSLFAFTYTSDNVSMMPALINTVLMTLATLIVAVPLGIFAAIYLVEYAKKGNHRLFMDCLVCCFSSVTANGDFPFYQELSP